MRSGKDVEELARLHELELLRKLESIARQVKQLTHLTASEQYDTALDLCRRAKLKGLTSRYRQEFQRPPTYPDLETKDQDFQLQTQQPRVEPELNEKQLLKFESEPETQIVTREIEFQPKIQPRGVTPESELQHQIPLITQPKVEFSSPIFDDRFRIKLPVFEDLSLIEHQNQDENMNPDNPNGDHPNGDPGNPNGDPGNPNGDPGNPNGDPGNPNGGPGNPNGGPGNPDQDPPENGNPGGNGGGNPGGNPDQENGGDEDQNDNVPENEGAVFDPAAFQRQMTNMERLLNTVLARCDGNDARNYNMAQLINQTRDAQTLDVTRTEFLERSVRNLDSKITARSSDPNPTKLRAYSKDSEDFSLFENRFITMWRTANWSDQRALSELSQNLQTPRAESVVRSKLISEWNVQTLLDACRDRLGADQTLAQVQAKLYSLEPKPDESPDEAMCRVEDVISKAQIEELERHELNKIQRQAFLRLIHVHEPMYFYVTENKVSSSDPYEALTLAKKYLRTRGHEADYFNKLVERQLQKRGIKEPETDSSEKSETKTSTQTSKKESITISAFNDLASKVDKLLSNSTSTATSNVATVDARYLPTNSQPEDWYKKLTATINEHERKTRIMQSEFQKMVDGLKSAGQFKQNTDQSQTKSTSNGSTSSSKKTFKKTNGKFNKPNGKRNGKFTKRQSGAVQVNFYGNQDDSDSSQEDSDNEDQPDDVTQE